MNWKKVSIERLKDYEARQAALISIPEQIRTLQSEFVGVKSGRTDGTPVKGGGNGREDVLINNIILRDELKRNLLIVKREVAITKKALSLLADDEQKVLYEFYIKQSKRHVEFLCDELGYEKTRVYNIKDSALKKFTLACYGIVEL